MSSGRKFHSAIDHVRSGSSRDHAGRARLAVDQRELAEVVARPEGRAGPAADDDLGAARLDHVEPAAGRALLGDGFVRPRTRAASPSAATLRSSAVGQLLEQIDLRQQVDARLRFGFATRHLPVAGARLPAGAIARAASVSAVGPRSIDAEQLRATCARHLGGPVTIEGLRRLSGGASRESWSFDAVAPTARATGSSCGAIPGSSLGQSDRSTEYRLLQAAAARRGPGPDRPVPARAGRRPRRRLRHGPHRGRDDPPPDPARRRVRRRASPGSPPQCGAIAAQIHAVDVGGAAEARGAGTARSRSSSTASILDTARRAASRVRARAALARGAHPGRPAADARAAPRARRLPQRQLHRRPRRHPLGPGLGALAPRRPGRGPRLAVREVVALRQRRPARRRVRHDRRAPRGVRRSRRRRPVDPEHLHYWETFGTLKWGVICEMQCFSHLHGLVRSVELAALGRRIAETEWDLLELIA